MSSKDQITLEIATYIVRGGGGYGAWYVGVTADPITRLFGGHGVQKRGDWWINREADSEDDARAIEQHFLKRGCDGGPGGGDQNVRYIYAYKKTAHTNQ